MKRIAAAALVLCLMSGTSALAQMSSEHHDRGAAPTKGAGPTHGGPPGGPVKALPITPKPGGPAGPANPGGRPSNPGNPTYPGGRPSNPGNPTYPGGRPSNPGNPTYPGGRPSYPGNPTYPGGRPSYGAPGYRPGGTRPYYNQQYFPRTFNMGNRYQWRGGYWSGPRGYYYRPWVFGQILPYGWYSPDWYINDYYDYGLPVPPYGYEWIRNGPDALLVNIASGLVVSSVPGIFY
jgi:Ni/Co efflux regulator RcnB